MKQIFKKINYYELKLKEIKKIYYGNSDDYETQFWKEFIWKDLNRIRKGISFNEKNENMDIELEISNLEIILNKYKTSFLKVNQKSFILNTNNNKKHNNFNVPIHNQTNTVKQERSLLILLAIFHKMKSEKRNLLNEIQLLHNAFFALENKNFFLDELNKFEIDQKELDQLIEKINSNTLLKSELMNLFPFGAFTKSVYNKFFSKDLYGKYDNEKENIILSSGSLSESEFSLSFALKNCINYAVNQDYVGYSHSLGSEQTRDAIVSLENSLLNEGEYNNSNVAITMGGQAGINLISENFKGSPTDEVVMLIPNYAPFMHLFEKNYNVKYISFMKDNDGDDLFAKINAAITPLTKLVVLVDVTNPTGIKIKKESLEQIIDLTRLKDIFVLIDEAGKCYLDKEYENPKNLSEDHVIRVKSLSKSHGIPGMKVGYILASSEIINNLYGLISASYGAPNSIFYTLLEFICRFDGYRISKKFNLSEHELKDFNIGYGLTLDALNIMYREYLINQNKYDEKVYQLKNYAMTILEPYVGNLIEEIIYPEGSLNICLKVKSNLSSYNFFLKLLKHKKIAVFPGICFGIYDGCWIRITFTVSKKDLENGLNHLIEFLKEESMYDYIKKNPSLKELLIVKGKYIEDPNINFLSHLYNVRFTMDFLLKHISTEVIKQIDREILEKLVMIHDTGKVLSIYINRYSRILKFSESQNNKLKINNLNKFNNKELLYTKSFLKQGNKHQSINIPDFLMKYSNAIERAKNQNVPDTFITNQILNEFLALEKFDDIKLSQSIKMFLTNSENIHLKILDLSDKLSDYYDTLKSKNIKEDLLIALKKKEVYVLWRYGRDGAIEELIKQDFKKTEEVIHELF